MNEQPIDCDTPPPITNFAESLQTAMALSPNDWNAHHRHAWMYGIIWGYDDECMAEVITDHGWNEPTVERLKRLHADFIACLGEEK